MKIEICCPDCNQIVDTEYIPESHGEDVFYDDDLCEDCEELISRS